MAQKRIAVIGAGVCGLSSIKCCLDEGLEPICFERSSDIGGLWRFEENPEEGRASIYKSVIINTSKEMMCFSDFPIPADFPNYMHHSKVMEYFRMYAEHFDLLKYICFKTTVVSVTKSPDFSTTGQWDVVTETEGKQESAIFDGVMVCTGHHSNAHLPLDSFPGIEKFKGCYFHSHDYKKPQEFSGKKVIVIGIGNSGTDLAVELSHTAAQVFLSTKRGAWILGRIGEEGYPLDTIYVTRYMEFLRRIVPLSLLNYFAEKKLNAKFNHAIYGLQPAHRYVKSQRYTIQAYYIPYMDEVACLAGVKPKLLSLFLMDPKLAVEVFFGPCTSYQYRLRKPGKWDGAREAILTQRERIIKPLKTRVLDDYTGASVPYYLQIFLIFALVAVTFAYFPWSFFPL
ncbi:flavin-containing monooxygenase 5-like isoform X2 [Dermochelys coriacea]|uniref:flavin-containing monooxygenase 5-like isoform X2 n=1 Tax=Dermochelys coriacea TaxID=27794 RepID=UPI001CA99351|nr:flavin-containing monooxygenase 5-like isoform X2 [Dermochelys coriacea]